MRYRRPDGGGYVADGHDIPHLVDLRRLLHAADQLAAGGRDADEEMQAVRELLDVGGTTLGGARPKASVVDDDGALSKFPHPGDDWDVMAWEKTALDLAERAGLTVPPRRLTKIDGCSVLILRRFDRGDTRRLGYASARTLTGLSDGDPADYLDLATAIADHSGQPDADLASMWRRIAIFTAVHNIDDHFRNHGFPHSPAGWALAPAFDVNPNPDRNKARATSISGSTAVSEEREALLEVAPYFGLTADHGVDVMAQGTPRRVPGVRSRHPTASRTTSCAFSPASSLRHLVVGLVGPPRARQVRSTPRRVLLVGRFPVLTQWINHPRLRASETGLHRNSRNRARRQPRRVARPARPMASWPGLARPGSPDSAVRLGGTDSPVHGRADHGVPGGTSPRVVDWHSILDESMASELP